MAVDLTLADLGVPERSTAVLDEAHVARVAATLDAPAVSAGERLPSLWHWTSFTPTTPTAGLGPDGHPVLGSAVMAPYPRRMWGAGRVEWDGELVVGASVERRSTLAAARTTSGGSGDLLIVTLAHEYAQDGVTRVREQQSLVYRSASSEAVPLPADGAAVEPPPGALVESRRPDPPLLFRFSAVTFNAHRIHYDAPYAREQEGYPGLVVHGPMTALRLAALAERRADRPLAAFEFKATAPMFAGLTATYVAEPPGADGTGSARAHRNDGAVAMQATYSVAAS